MQVSCLNLVRGESMASTSGRKNSSARKKSTGRRNTNKSTYTKKQSVNSKKEELMLHNEIVLIVSFAVLLLLFLCNFGVIGPVGNAISGILFGVLGFLAYLFPVCLFLWVAFGISNRGNHRAMLKLSASVVLFFCIGIILELFTGNIAVMEQLDAGQFYQYSSVNKSGGGVLFGILAYALCSLLDIVGTVIVLLVLMVICFVVITGKSVVHGVREQSKKVYSSAREDVRQRNEQHRVRREEIRKREEQESIEKEGEKNGKEAEKILRINKKVSGVMLNTSLKEDIPKAENDEVHEITLEDLKDIPENISNTHNEFHVEGIDEIKIHAEAVRDDYEEIPDPFGFEEKAAPEQMPDPEEKRENLPKASVRKESSRAVTAESSVPAKSVSRIKAENYVFPPLSLLKRGSSNSRMDSKGKLRETAVHLQKTLETFGVKVTVTDISQGPSVTRYELQPEPGVKVSRIVNLADDIKLNLAAADIRIEAPIPGKSAVGIEVPNKENSTVAFRDLIESREFKDFNSNIAFAVGKDISGKVVVSDIAKMPHMLIAGATGSGKSVCINTIIMSILYKAHPDDVKLILVDPKVVELSVYNGIPHLMIPVVTDPKKAASALNWAVAEMSERYKKFADFNVRDLKGYNKAVKEMRDSGKEDAPAKMPQLVIIVDELADLMMVAAHEVEESICRLAQLARAAGIHLIIATQRPSVDVITGLIKANMPSRVAFAVSSGVDSRTILDMNGAEKLLGKGDMLYYPQGYAKPVRIQGAFISDGEVSDVVDFLKNQQLGNTYSEEIEEEIKNISSGQGGSGVPGMNERDEYFVSAGEYIIEKDKGSIGMLQRVFKIGFNRAARIMDQLAEAGVVGEEEGTKPRKVLMSIDQFREYVDEYL